VVTNNALVHVLGIRHHGPGSSRSLISALTALQPDCILIEGPPDANHLLKHGADVDMNPPVALLVYAQDNARRAVYYPFASFSPEWQAIRFGLTKGADVQFMDLPQTHWLALEDQQGEKTGGAEGQRGVSPAQAELAGGNDAESASALAEAEAEDGNLEDDEQEPDSPVAESARTDPASIRSDPLTWLASAAGYNDGERWWEQLVEQRKNSTDLFIAIREAMTTLRKDLPGDSHLDRYEPLREAHMRQIIRAAQKQGFQRIAVVCGAWHAPALYDMPSAKEDASLLKGLPKKKVEATWIPWTHGRLTYGSGYGAGVTSPGWYHHLWTCSNLVSERWMANVARLLRERDLDASSAHVIEAVRLAESLAAIRGHPLPGLPELSEATQAVLCFGDDAPMRLIHEKLIVGEALGKVPTDIPTTPLQQDLGREQKRLRLPPQAAEKVLDLDLRNQTDLQRSHLLHRLALLGIPWGDPVEVRGKSGGFHEIWRLRWVPEFSLSLIEAGVWGRTIAQAASAYACDRANQFKELPQLTVLLDRVLLCDLHQAVDHVVDRVQNEAAVASDIKHLMDALPPLVHVARYGNVRKTDAAAVLKIVDGLVVRVCVGLVGACSSLDDPAAQEMFAKLVNVHSAINLLQDQDHTRAWHAVLKKLSDIGSLHGLVAGKSCRLLFDNRVYDTQEAARRFGLALSTASEPPLAASWAEGFLTGSGLVLIHDQSLFNVIDEWVSDLSREAFTHVLPLMRRTFSTFTPPERRQLGERVAHGSEGGTRTGSAPAGINEERANRVLPLVARILGLEGPGNQGARQNDDHDSN